MKRERLDFLADNPLYTKRFAYYVGRRCRSATIKDVAAELKLDWHTVKALEQQYMEAQLKRAGRPSPQVIGIDEIAIRKGHSYRIYICCAGIAFFVFPPARCRQQIRLPPTGDRRRFNFYWTENAC
ncbi:MAG TPA: helix-turn-helix domain-containing protein [Rhabdochlamydiaceae bacterium]|nr:helix-turn-helix domain-containing protein [Rhabdochlamydiaceae bacterium]